MSPFFFLCSSVAHSGNLPAKHYLRGSTVQGRTCQEKRVCNIVQLGFILSNLIIGSAKSANLQWSIVHIRNLPERCCGRSALSCLCLSCNTANGANPRKIIYCRLHIVTTYPTPLQLATRSHFSQRIQTEGFECFDIFCTQQTRLSQK